MDLEVTGEMFDCWRNVYYLGLNSEADIVDRVASDWGRIVWKIDTVCVPIVNCLPPLIIWVFVP